jgi:glucose-6-phosphate 1-epimerase
MDTRMPDSLNARFALGQQLQFVAGKGGLTRAVIHNALASATVSLYAGQVLSWQPASAQYDGLFLSEQAFYQPGKAIKGGVPVCWPWFGPDPEGRGRPAHGFARTSQWDVLSSAALENGATQLVLGLKLNEATRALWHGVIEAQLEIVVGNTLRLALTTFNHGSEPIELTQALHTYFAVGDIDQTTVHGLDGKSYLDKVDGGQQKTQAGAVKIASEVDRIYTGVSGDLEIHDAAWQRVIHIHAGGSSSAVVWNPWKEIAAGMADLGDEDYRRMLCVETTNAGPDVIRIAPGAEYTFVAEYAVGTISKG